MPGVHSDIGGSYVDGEKEVSVLYCQKGSIINDIFFNIEEECKKYKEILIDEGWYKDEELEIKSFYQSDLDPDILWTKDSSSFYGIIGTRVLSNSYDKVALNLVFHYSQNKKNRWREVFGYCTIRPQNSRTISYSNLQPAYPIY